MAHVFAATDITGQAPPVAIKVVSRMNQDETLMARLHREVEAAARIKSEYVPHVFEVSDTDEREMYFVMERLVGEPLSQRMRDRGALPWSEVLQIGNDVLRGLIDAHTAGVVHRDIKPSNVFLALKNGRVRAMVLDFGVCKTDGVDAERLTGTGEAIGTVAYMAPEQIRGASKVDDRADLYAFGVLVFEMICGRLPHDGPSQMAILASKLENAPARLGDCAQVVVPEGLDAVVAKALARNPKDRFASAQELLKAWRKLGKVSDASSPTLLDTGSGPTLQGLQGLDEAPTSLAITDEVPTIHANVASIPPEAHPTQTALTAGISLKKGSPGRIALGLAAFALVAGIVGVVVAFTRAPAQPVDLNAESQAAAAGLGAAPPPAEATASVPSLAVAAPSATAGAGGATEGAPTIELGETPAPPSSAKASPPAPVAAPRAGGRAARPPAPAAGKPNATHITSQPRY